MYRANYTCKIPYKQRLCVELLVITPIFSCTQHLCVELLVIIPVRVPCRVHMRVELFVIIPVIVP